MYQCLPGKNMCYKLICISIRNILINEHNSLKNYLDEKFIVFILEIQLQTLLHKKIHY